MEKQKDVKVFDYKSDSIDDEELLLIEMDEQISMTTSGEVVKLHEKRTTTMPKRLYVDTIDGLAKEDKQRAELNMSKLSHPLRGSKALDVAVEVPVKQGKEYHFKIVAKSELTDEDKKAIESFAN